jgi:hypothetical protein
MLIIENFVGVYPMLLKLAQLYSNLLLLPPPPFLIVFGEIIAVYSANRTKINTQRGQNAVF